MIEPVPWSIIVQLQRYPSAVATNSLPEITGIRNGSTSCTKSHAVNAARCHHLTRPPRASPTTMR